MAKKVMASEVIQPNLFKDTIESADALILKLTELNSEFKATAEISKEAIKGSKFDSVKSMNDLVKATENATKLQKIQLQVENELNKALKLKGELQEKLVKADLISEKVANEKLRGTIMQTKEDERQAKATERKIVAETRLQSAYNRVNTWLGKLRNEYRDLAIKKELGAQLTAKEEFRYANLEKRIQTYDSALKKVDGTMGMHQRNVGNYASGWNGLGNSINQLSREMPAFANSVSTGFMAISNNLPMLFDELSKIKKANAELKLQGIETKSALSQVGSAIFSWGTALSVGVTLLTLFGAKMIDWVENALSPANNELEEMNKKQKRIEEDRKKQTEYISKESAMYVGLVLALKQTNKGTQERRELIKTINDQYGTTLQNLSDEKKFQDQLNKSVENYIAYKKAEFLIKKNEDLISRNLTKQESMRNELKTLRETLLIQKASYETRSKGLKDFNKAQLEEQTGLTKTTKRINELEQALIDADKRLQYYGFSIGKNRIVTEEYEDATKKSTETTKNKAEAQKELNEYTSKYLSIIAKIIDVQNQNKIEAKQGLLDTEINKQTLSAEKTGEFDMTKIKAILEEIEVLKLNANYAEFQANEDLIKEKYDALQKEYEAKRDTYKKDSKEYLYYQEQLKKIEKDRLAEQELNFEELMAKRNKILNDSAKEEIEIKKDIAEADKKFDEDELKRKAEKFDKYAKLAKASADLFIFLSNKKVQATEKEISALQKQQDFLQNLAVNGNILAQQSLAQNEKLQAEANKKKEKELKKQENIKIASTVFEAYAKNAGDKDVKNPVIKTISDVSILQAFIQSLATFYEGTETTVGEALGMPQLQGKDGYIVRVDKDEKILNPSLSAKTGNLTTKEIAQISEDRLRGKLMYKGEAMQTNVGYENILLLNEISELKEIIKSKPETNISMGEIVGGVMHLVESTKVRNTTTRNIHRFNNKI